MRRYTLLLLPLLYLVLWLVAVGCGDVHHDNRLVEIERLSEQYSDSSTAAAVSRLELIDRSTLSESDRRYYDFLRVKTADKAYITHTSDSLILSVIDYAASHRRELSYAEALYYGGRVYSDIGDYPTALRYFQQALDEMPESNEIEILDLRGRIFSQAGQLLNTLRLYDEAVPYIEKAIGIGAAMKDSVAMMRDIQLLGSVYLRAEKYDTAEIKFRTAYRIAEKVLPVACYTQRVCLGVIKYNIDELDSALSLIKPVLHCMDTLDRNYALGYLGDIYLRKGRPDSAYMYARHLIWDKDSYNRPIGYKLALSPELRKFIPEDSLDFYIDGYWNLLQESLNNNESHSAVLQNSVYNYHLHERERMKAESSRDRLRLWLVVIVLSVMLLISLLIGIIMYQKAVNRKDLLRLHEALDSIEGLRRSISQRESDMTTNEMMGSATLLSEKEQRETEVAEAAASLSESERLHLLRARLRDELLALVHDSKRGTSVSPDIISSEAYSRLEVYARRGDVIPDSSPLWEQLEQTVLASSDKFRYRLQLLTGSPLKVVDYRMVLLLKCGMTPTQLTNLLGRAKGTIGYKRESLSIKMFGEKLDMKVIDEVIRLL